MIIAHTAESLSHGRVGEVGMKVVWLSSGVSSFVAGYLAKDVDEWIYIDIEDQHPDSILEQDQTRLSTGF